jgi:hypothetical protein
MSDTPTILSRDVETALKTAKRLARSLDDIRAVDYGFAYKADRPTDRLSIRFHMNRKRRLNELPRNQRLPESIEGVPVDVLAVGYMLHGANPRTAQEVLQPGISIGNLKLKTTGTLGVWVTDLTTQELCILSNWHVLCGGPEAAVGDQISQPGPMDLGSNPGHEVARLERWLRLSEQFDAAMARIVEGVKTNFELFATAVRPTGTSSPSLGMRMLKSGAVSGVTHAIVDGIGGSYRLDYTGYGDGPEWMEGFRLVPDPENPSNALSLEGDSGSLWMDSAGRRAVGLHFAGEDDLSPLNDYALAHSIEEIFARLNVRLAS